MLFHWCAVRKVEKGVKREKSGISIEDEVEIMRKSSTYLEIMVLKIQCQKIKNVEE